MYQASWDLGRGSKCVPALYAFGFSAGYTMGTVPGNGPLALGTGSGSNNTSASPVTAFFNTGLNPPRQSCSSR
jgi:hypothetical protein